MTQELFGSIVSWLLILALGVFCLLWFIEPISKVFWRWRNPPEKVAAEYRVFQDRLLHPDWAVYERYLQRPVPAELRELFADRDLILTEGIDYSESETIAGFCAIDEKALTGCRSLRGFAPFPIAANIFGDPIYLRPGAAEPNIVYVTYHDGGDTEKLAPDMETFLRCLRNRNKSGEFLG